MFFLFLTLLVYNRDVFCHFHFDFFILIHFDSVREVKAQNIWQLGEKTLILHRFS